MQQEVKLVFGLDIDRFPNRSLELKCNKNWSDVNEIAFFLWPEEKAILNLLAMGKKYRQIAEILDCGTLQATAKATKLMLDVLKFYAKHFEGIKQLVSGNIQIDRKDLLVVRGWVVWRKTISELSKEFGFSRSTVLRKIDKAILGFKKKNDKLYSMMIDRRTIIGHRKRKRRTSGMIDKDAWRDKVVDFLLTNTGNFFYVWGGQNLKSGDLDCSGLVIEVLKKFGKLSKNFGDARAQGLSKLFPIAKNPLPGDLAFYGKDWKNVNHVMFFIGDASGWDNAVAGMTGGYKNMTRSESELLGAGLWVRKSARYRRDFLGFRRV